MPHAARFSTVLTATVLCLSALAGCKHPQDQVPGVGTPVTVGHLDGKVIPEASGLAPSLLRPGALWVNNDSGDNAVLYQIGPDGRELGRARIAKVDATDWEDCASFHYQGRAWLLAADTGDNDEHRPFVTLHIFPEPAPGELHPGTETLVDEGWSIRVRYPDGSHDCESVGVDVAGGRIYLISKRAIPHVLYSVPLKPVTQDEIVAKRLCSLDWLKPVTGLSAAIPTPQGRYGNQPTGLSISQDDRMAVLLTYKEAYLYRRAADQDWKDVFATRGTPLPPHHLDQAEGICIDAEGKAVFITGEGNNTALLRYDLKPAE